MEKFVIVIAEECMNRVQEGMLEVTPVMSKLVKKYYFNEYLDS